MAVRHVPVLVVTGLVTVISMTGCAASTSTLRSKTPAIPAGTGSSSEKRALLTTGDLQGLPGAPPDIKVNSPKQPNSIYQNPDQIGPCGKKLAIPRASKMATIEFGSATFNGFQLVLDAPVVRATAFVTAWQDDTRPGCPSASSLTNTGSKQTQELVSTLPLPGLVDQESGALLRITNMGQTVAAYALVFRSGGRLDFIVFVAARPLSSAFESAFAQKAEVKLNGSMGITASQG